MDALRNYGLFGLAALLVVVSFTVTTGDLEPYAIIPQLAAILAACGGLVLRTVRTGLIATCVAGFGFAYYLFQQKITDEAGTSLCDIDAVISCGAVNGSEWSTVAGIPIALIGMAFYAGLALAGLSASDDADAPPTFERLALLTGIPSVIYSLFLAWISKQIGAFCVFCISMYVANALILWGGWLGLARRGAAPFEGLGALFRKEGVLFGLALVVIVVVGQDYYTDHTDMPSIPAAGQRTADGDDAVPTPADYARLYQAPAGPLSFDGTEPLLGSPDAEYIVVEFADFGCPHCARASKALKDLVKSFPEIAVRYKYFPLSGPCNPHLEARNTAVCDATFAAECAHRQGRFWEMSNQLFSNQGFFEPEQLEFMAKDIGLDVDAWKQCLQDPATAEAITDAADAGEQVGVRGTPAMYLRGVTPDGFVEIKGGVDAIAALVDAHRNGLKLPAPKAP